MKNIGLSCASLVGTLIVASCTAPVAIGGASTSGTTLTLSAGSGETYTHNDAIPSSIVTVNKTGAGEVVLAAASPNCGATSVAIQSGTLTISDLGALGASAPITGWGYTTLRLKTPRGASSTDGLFLNHLITLGNYATFEYVPTTEGADSDRLISALTLTTAANSSATLRSDARWGIYAGRLNPQGNTLNKAGSGELFLENTILGAGNINLNAGKMAFKGNMTFNATSANTFNYTTGANGLAFHSVTARFPYALTLTAWRTLTIASGAAESMNVFTGPITVNSSVTVTATGDDCSMRFDGPIRSGTSPSLQISKLAKVGLNGDISLAGALRLSNAGGWANCSSNAVRDVLMLAFSGGNLLLENGILRTPMLRIANAGALGGVLRQTGGTFVGSSLSDTALVGEQSGSRGSYVLEGGEAIVSNALTLAKSAGSFGGFFQRGGSFEAHGEFRAGDAGTTLFHQGGGSFFAANANTTVNGGVAEVAITGEGTRFGTARFQLGGSAVGTNVVTVADGGTLEARRFGVANTVNAMASTTILNLDGGILAPASNGVWSVYNGLLPVATVYGGGAIIDTSASGGAIDWTAALNAPVGKSIASITLPAEAFAADYVNGHARIVVEGPGSGASAYARVGFPTNRLSEVVILCGGQGYDATTKVYVESPDRATRHECAYTLADAEGGALVKRGANDLLLHTANTYSGGTVVENGKLIAKVAGAVPANAPLCVANGAELNLPWQPLTVSRLSGSGRVTGGNVIVTDALEASCEDLFAGKFFYVASGLVFENGAKFIVTDPENLVRYKDSRGAVAFEAAAITGEPELVLGDGSSGPTTWRLLKKSAKLFMLKSVHPLVMVVR